jgi:hypothetical protein
VAAVHLGRDFTRLFAWPLPLALRIERHASVRNPEQVERVVVSGKLPKSLLNRQILRQWVALTVFLAWGRQEQSAFFSAILLIAANSPLKGPFFESSFFSNASDGKFDRAALCEKWIPGGNQLLSCQKH